MTRGVAGIGPEEVVAYGAAVQGDLLSAESQFEETLGEMWSDANVLEVRNTHRQECRQATRVAKAQQPQGCCSSCVLSLRREISGSSPQFESEFEQSPT
eukprot:COSAG06_NODE_4974_length_3817_cov_1.671329_2_plen_99_part_00